MIEYHSAVRGAFFDIAHPADSADDIARHGRYLDDGVLFIHEGKIQALLPWQEGEAHLDGQKGYLDLRGQLLLPGFVDAHVHYPQTEMIGAFGEQLLEWLTTYTFPVESQFSDEEYAADIAQFFINQLLSHGTTTALVFCTLHPESVDALFTEALRLNMRLLAGKVMMDRHAPDYLSETAEQSYRQTRELIQRWHHRGRLGYAITPRFAPTSTPELLAAVQQLREEFPDTWLHTHLSENLTEVAWVNSLWPEHEHYLDVYHHYGLTGERSVFAHGIHLAEKEWQCLHDTGSAVAFCPTSNLFLGSGLFRLPASWQHKVRIGIGSDVGAGTTFSMLRTLGEAYKVAQLQSYRLRSCEAFYHATLGGARALRLDDKIGNFQPGKEADFVAIDLTVTPLQRLRMSRCQDIYERLFVLMTLGDERNIRQTWVNGECVWRSET
ncbi:guanine deaminase [Enterobacter sp. JUb54]|uniref:guanine deaminase n=1 Tax=Enterobacteriaceae TaxID=543 RepID=UPI00164E5DD5|nr:guanine deaminase [Enterobacter sp. JUb54]QNK09667.1 guanine deaminase [Enterobacter sp. JUb54]